MQAIDRFWLKVNVDGPIPKHRPELGPCSDWTASTKNGYGRFGVASSDGWLAHRWIWQHTHGPIPDGLCVLHRCDNRRCVRIDHLFLGTYFDNHADMVEKGRAVYVKGSRNGRSKLTEDQVVELRRLRANGMGVVELGRRFAIDASQVSRICTGASRS